MVHVLVALGVQSHGIASCPEDFRLIGKTYAGVTVSRFTLSLRKAEGRLASALGYTPRLKQASSYHSLVNPKTGRQIGDVSFAYRPDDKTIFIDTVSIDRHHQSMGASRVLLGSLLDRYPETKVIYLESLSMDNMDVYRKAIAEGYSQLAAVKKTPAYKIREYFGFTELKIIESPSGDISLIATRPK